MDSKRGNSQKAVEFAKRVHHVYERLLHEYEATGEQFDADTKNRPPSGIVQHYRKFKPNL